MLVYVFLVSKNLHTYEVLLYATNCIPNKIFITREAHETKERENSTRDVNYEVNAEPRVWRRLSMKKQTL